MIANSAYSLARNVKGYVQKYLNKKSNLSSEKYWRDRYSTGGHSGAGSYGKLAEFKAKILNNFIIEEDIRSVIEFGCGDGNQLSLARYPHYLGYDITPEAVRHCRIKFGSDASKEFALLPSLCGESGSDAIA